MSNATTTALLNRANRLLSHVVFQDYSLVARVTMAGEVYMAGSYVENDIYSGEPDVQHTRRWTLHPGMSDSQIVQTAFKLCLTSMEHRTRGAFTYKNARVFGPHIDVEDLVQLCHSGREAAGGG